jgi:murein DD-endopeptidase MepM/ murein hydrolase activator NlpD
MLHVLGFEAGSRAARPLAWLLGGVVVLVLAGTAGTSLRGSASGPGLVPLRAAVVTQGFGCTSFALEPVDPACPGGHFHSGIDLAAPSGTPIYSVSAGVASLIVSQGGFGIHVIVDAGGGLAFLYGHMSGVAVPADTEVAAGELLGWVGSTGNSSGPHLHFQVISRGYAVDPSPWLPAYGGATQPGGDRRWSTKSF